MLCYSLHPANTSDRCPGARQVSEAATLSAAEATARASQAAAIAAAFPTLPGGQQNKGGAADSIGTGTIHEETFSDEDDGGIEKQQPGIDMPQREAPRPQREELPANSLSSDGAASALTGKQLKGFSYCRLHSNARIWPQAG